jgi:homoserine O-acetyltransferase
MRALWAFVAALVVTGLAGAAEPPPLVIADLGDLTFENGAMLHDAKLAYRHAGKLNADKSNAILFPTWFTGTSEDLFASGSLDAIDTERFFLIAVDAFANGVSSSPSNHPGFPSVTIGDMVAAQHRLLSEVFGIERLYAVMGISMGGMQTFEWVTAYPGFVERAMPIVGSPRLASYDVLLWEAQIEAIELARQAGDVERAAALTGMISSLALQAPRHHARRTPRSDAVQFLQMSKQTGSQGMLDREAQLRAMLTHDVSRRFDGAMEKAASMVTARVVNVVAIEDHMVTPQPAIRFAALLGAESFELESDCGHLAPGCEVDQLNEIIGSFLQ